MLEGKLFEDGDSKDGNNGAEDVMMADKELQLNHEQTQTTENLDQDFPTCSMVQDTIRSEMEKSPSFRIAPTFVELVEYNMIEELHVGFDASKRE